MNEVRQNPNYLFYKRNAYFVFWFQALNAIVSAAIFFPPFSDLPTASLTSFPSFVPNISTPVYIVLLLIGLAMIYTDRLVIGVNIFIIVILAGFVVAPFFTTNLGFFLGALLGLLIWLISLLTMPPPHSTRGIILGVFGAVLVIIVEFFGPTDRSTNVPFVTSIYLVVTTTFLFYIFIFFRNLDLYTLQSKFLFITIGLAVLSSIATFLGINQTTTLILNQFSRNEVQSTGDLLKAVSENQARAITDQIRAQFILFQSVTRDEQVITFLESNNDEFDAINEQTLTAVLAGRKEIWLTNNPEFASLKHILFFSTLRNPISDQLRGFIEEQNPTEQIIFTNRFGAIIAMATRDEGLPYLYTNTDWWPIVSGEGEREPDFFIGDPVFVRSSGELGIPIAMPVINNSGQFVGAIQTILPLKDLINDVSTNQSNSSANIELALIYDELMIPIEANSISPKELNFDIAELSELNSQVFVETEVGQVSSLLTAAPISVSSDPGNIENNLAVVVTKPRLDVTNVFQTQNTRELLLGSAIIIISTLIGYTLARLISNPISQLSSVAERLEGGDLSARAEIKSEDEIGILASSFNAMADQSQRLVNQLETRVKERTNSLQTSFRVSQALSQITDKQELVQAVVDQLRDAFDYYHVHIYLYSKESERLKLVAGSGPVGQQLLTLEHSLAIGQGLVGRAAQNNLTVLVPNVENEPQWVPNRLLPETKSEVATPIAIGDNILGVIDVQENEVDRLQEEDTELLESIARQVAVALQNAEQIERFQNAAKRESSINQIREKILNTDSIDDAMKTAVKELGRVLAGKKAKVVLTSDQSPEPVSDKLQQQEPRLEMMTHHEKNKA